MKQVHNVFDYRPVCQLIIVEIDLAGTSGDGQQELMSRSSAWRATWAVALERLVVSVM